MSATDDTNIKQEIATNIKALTLKDKIKAVALNYYLEEKKKYDEQLEKEIRELNAKYE